MNKKTKRNGQAFPVHAPAIDYGMTLRQRYAIAALPMLIYEAHKINDMHFDSIAEDAFKMADAMIAHEEAENDGKQKV